MIALWKRLWEIRIFNFMFVGSCGFILNLCIYYPLTVLIHNKITFLSQVFYLPALLISTPIVIAFNYWINKKWTYRGYAAKSLSLARYEFMGLCTAIFDVIVLFLLVQFGHIYYLLAMVMAAIIMFGMRYFISNKWVWKTSEVKV
jgi:putative flippase GtrA